MGCNCEKRQMYGNGFGLGISTDQGGQSWLGGKQIVGWQGDMPITTDSHGNMFANILNMNTGTYMTGVQMPTSIAARGGGRGPIATSPTGSGRVFWADEPMKPAVKAGIGLATVGLLFGALIYYLGGTVGKHEMVSKHVEGTKYNALVKRECPHCGSKMVQQGKPRKDGAIKLVCKNKDCNEGYIGTVSEDPSED